MSHSRRFFSNTYVQDNCSTRSTRVDHNLLSFLAALTDLEVTILPITYQVGMGKAGRGSTSTINQAFMSVETSFVFKCVSDWEKRRCTESEIFEVLINEIGVLSHFWIATHPYIVSFEGICWDTSTDDEVWPVFVFEKSEIGDLYNFLQSPIGRELPFYKRLHICVCIGMAINDLHFLGVVHGDIKPQNVIIFQRPDGNYDSKLIDFGFSGRYMNENSELRLLGTEPWIAHWRSQKCTPAEGRRSDIFSFGIYCLWVLFEKYLSSVIPLPPGAEWAKAYQPMAEDEDHSLSFILQLKKDNKLSVLAKQLMDCEPSLDETKREALEEFFEIALQPISGDLDSAFRVMQFFPSLNPTLPTNYKSKVKSSTESSRFEIQAMKLHLYQADPQVRTKIHSLLAQKVLTNQDANTDSLKDDIDPNLAFQLAISFKLGFGGREDDQVTHQLLLQSGKSTKDLNDAILQVHDWGIAKEHPNPIQPHLQRHGDYNFPSLNAFELRTRQEELKLTELKLRDEINQLEAAGIENSPLKLMLCSDLAHSLFGQRLWDECAVVTTQVFEMNKEMRGPEHPHTLVSMQNLADIYQESRRYQEAKVLLLQLLDIGKTVFNAHSLSVARIKISLATLLYHENRLQESLDLWIQVTDILEKQLSPSHAETMDAVGNIASILGALNRWEEADSLFQELLERNTAINGANHPRTVAAMMNIAASLFARKQWKECESLLVTLLKLSQEILEDKNVITMQARIYLGRIFLEQNRGNELGPLILTLPMDAIKMIYGMMELPDRMLGWTALALMEGVEQSSEKIESEIFDALGLSLLQSPWNKAPVTISSSNDPGVHPLFISEPLSASPEAIIVEIERFHPDSRTEISSEPWMWYSMGIIRPKTERKLGKQIQASVPMEEGAEPFTEYLHEQNLELVAISSRNPSGAHDTESSRTQEILGHDKFSPLPETFRIVWTRERTPGNSNDPSVNGSDYVQTLKAGDRIAVDAGVRSLGTSLHVQSISVRCYCRDENQSLPTEQESEDEDEDKMLQRAIALSLTSP